MRRFLRNSRDLSTQDEPPTMPAMADPISPAHSAAARINGASGGYPTGKQRPPLLPPTPERVAAAIEHAANCVIEGQSPYNASAFVNPITERDRRQLARFTGITAEEFTARLTDRLRALADLTADRIQQKLSDDKFKPHELSFLLTVAVDKLQRTEGRSQIAGAQVNVQINNFGPDSREAVLARLTGQTFDIAPATPATDPAAIPPTPPDVAPGPSSSQPPA